MGQAFLSLKSEEKMRLMAILLISAVCLSGCGAQAPQSYRPNDPVNPQSDEILQMAEGLPLEPESNYYLGTGIRINEFDEKGNMVPSERGELFPVYREEVLIGLLLHEDNEEFLTDEGILMQFSERTDKAYCVFWIGSKICLADETGVTFLSGNDNISLTEQQKKALEVLQNTDMEDNPMGSECVQIRMGAPASTTLFDPVTGHNFSSSRIAVRFTEGDEENKILQYEEFCGGKLHGKVRSAGVYTFVFTPKSNIKQLNALLRKTLELDYIEDAWLEEAKGLH